ERTGWDLLRGEKDQVNEFEELSATERRAVRDERPDLLFDREADPHETTDLADERPDVVERLEAYLPEA
ncbi:MAG: hypothetical protein ABEJ04_06535, partial [Halobacteriaceae archaeon]